MISRNIKSVSSIATAFAIGMTVLGGSAGAYQVSVDQLVIYKNGGLYINDEFNGGVAPPAAGSNFGSGSTPATYRTLGTWTESGGRAIADSANNPLPSVSPYDGNTTRLHDARLNSSTGTNTAIGLRNDDNFYAMALFDLSSVLDKNDSSYNLRFRDSGGSNITPGSANDDARIGVRRTDTGNLIVRFGDFDAGAGTFNILDVDALQAGHDQILLRLDHDVSGGVTGSYAYVNGGLDLTDAAGVAGQTFINMDGSINLFDGENWTRASLAAFETIPAPEPGIALIFAAGLAGLAMQRRRRRT